MPINRYLLKKRQTHKYFTILFHTLVSCGSQIYLVSHYNNQFIYVSEERKQNNPKVEVNQVSINKNKGSKEHI
jgi:hypothetical protein